jgi:hypothetical protein
MIKRKAIRSTCYSPTNQKENNKVKIVSIEHSKLALEFIKKSLNLNIEQSDMYTTQTQTQRSKISPMAGSNTIKYKTTKYQKSPKKHKAGNHNFVGLQQKLDQMKVRLSNSCLSPKINIDASPGYGETMYAADTHIKKPICLDESSINDFRGYPSYDGLNRAKIENLNNDRLTGSPRSEALSKYCVNPVEENSHLSAEKPLVDIKNVKSNTFKLRLNLTTDTRIINIKLPQSARNSKLTHTNGLFSTCSPPKTSPSKKSKSKRKQSPEKDYDKGKKNDLDIPSAKISPRKRDFTGKCLIGIADVLKAARELLPSKVENKDEKAIIILQSARKLKSGFISPKWSARHHKDIALPSTSLQFTGISQVFGDSPKYHKLNNILKNSTPPTLYPEFVRKYDTSRSHIHSKLTSHANIHSPPAHLHTYRPRLSHQPHTHTPSPVSQPQACKTASHRSKASPGHGRRQASRRPAVNASFADGLDAASLSKIESSDNVGNDGLRRRLDTDVDELFTSLFDHAKSTMM